MRPSCSSPVGLVQALLLVALAAGCDPGRGEVRPWQREDHGGDPSANVAQPQRDIDPAQIVERIWAQRCHRCHGATGKGDGPMAREFNPPDLTRPEWLETVKDEEIARTIKRGKGSMPANAEMPDAAIQLLTQRIRMRGAPVEPEEE